MMDLSSYRTNLSSEMVMEVPNTSDDDDIHICGACKLQFSDIFVFMRHKSKGSCVPVRNKSNVSITVSQSVTSVISGAQRFSSFASVGTEIHTAVLPSTKYEEIAIESDDSFTGDKQNHPHQTPSPQPLETPQPPHLLLAELALRQQAIDGLDSTATVSEESNSRDVVGSDRLIGQTTEWDSPWSRTTKPFDALCPSSPHKTVQQQFALSEQGDAELRKVHELRTDKVYSHRVNRQHDQLIGQDSRADEVRTTRTSLRRSDFLDVEEDVATLLANHLANEPPLHMYPSTSESLLPYGNMSGQLGLSEETADPLNFESDTEENNNEEHQPQTHVVAVSNSNTNKCNLKKRPPPDLAPPAKRIREAASIKVASSPPPQNLQLKATPVNMVHVKQNSQHPVQSSSNPAKKAYSCTVDGCGYRGLSSRDLNRHMCTHTGERPYKCPLCGRGFTRSDKLTTHLRIHSGAKSYKCNVCDYACVDHTGLVRHMRTHTDERPYKCQICDYSARVLSHLKVHLRTHTGDLPYLCSLNCGKAFKTSSDLKRHERVHAGEKPYACSRCSYRACLKSNLQTHMRVTHSTNQTYPCPQCKLVFYSKRDLREHKRTHAEHLQHCNKCDYACVTPTAMKNHQKTHSLEKPFSCKLCSFTTNKRGNYRAHMRKKHSYPVPKISKMPLATIDEQETVPEKQALHHCPCCNAAFKHVESLRNHLQEYHLEEPVQVLGSSPSPPPLESTVQSPSPSTAHSPPSSPPPQDPVLGDGADSRDSVGSSNSIASCGAFSSLGLTASTEQPQPIYLYRYISPELSDNIRGAEILASLNQGGGASLPQYVTIQADQNSFVEAFGSMQYVLSSPLGTLDDNDSPHLLC